MTLLKILFLLLIIIPFALFLLYILERLMDEMPSKDEMEAEMSPVERRRSRAAARNRKSRTVNHRQDGPSAAEKRRRRKARKTERKQQRKAGR